MTKPLWSIVLVILLTAAATFFIGNAFGMELPAFLYIVIAVVGLFLYLVILVVASDSKRLYEDTDVKGRAK